MAPSTRRASGSARSPARSASPRARRSRRGAKELQAPRTPPVHDDSEPAGRASPTTTAVSAPSSSTTGWHATVGTAPQPRGRTRLARFGAVAVQLAVMTVTPPAAQVTVHIIRHNAGVLSAALGELAAEGPLAYLARATPLPSGRAVQLLVAYAVFQAALLMGMPGKTFYGPITAGGNRPVYKANGVQCLVATFATYFALLRAGVVDPVEVYLLMPEMVAALSAFSFLFCAFLFVKGRVAPSSSDSGSGGSLIGDFYWGLELYPRLFGNRLDIKTFTNCRCGMMGWGVLCVTFAAAQADPRMHGQLADSMAVCVALMLAYIIKFFVWETGYWTSMDIMHDRAGYMICWGCLTWVPAVYTSPAMYLVERPIQLGAAKAAALLAAGAAAVWVNYDADKQRQRVRKADGAASVWGRPAEVIRAHYVTASGETKSSLLLLSGWWGVARHFHYVPELLAAFLWSAPAGFDQPLPYFYVVFLTALLVDRAARDDARCGSKYGAAWVEYCARVPYRMIPYIY